MYDVGDLTSTKDKVNLQYISGSNPHITSWFYEDELGLNSLSNMISSPTYEMTMPPREQGVLEISHRLEIRQIFNI